jgi:hypothetical protein
MGRPAVGAKMHELNAAIERVATQQGALVLDLRAFSARNLVMADHVHPTALGQIAMAGRALDVLERDGMRVMVRPSELVYFETTRWDRLRGDATYAYRYLKEGAKAMKAVAVEQVRRRRG